MLERPSDMNLRTTFGISLLAHAAIAAMLLALGHYATHEDAGYYKVDLVDLIPLTGTQAAPKDAKPAPPAKPASTPTAASALPARPAPVIPKAAAPPADAMPESMDSAGPYVNRTPELELASPRPSVSPAPVTGRAGIFDHDVIARQAERAEELAKAGADGQDGISFDTREAMYAGYMRMLKDKIESIWTYPREAAEKGIYGDLMIEFVILRDGRLGSVRVLRTSGYSMLDKAALDALRRAEPYWPLPDGWQQSSITVPGRFIYTLNGFYVR